MRFAFGGKCGPLRRPRWLPRRSDVSAPRSAENCTVGSWFRIILLFRDRLVEVEDRARHHGPRREFGLLQPRSGFAKPTAVSAAAFSGLVMRKCRARCTSNAPKHTSSLATGPRARGKSKPVLNSSPSFVPSSRSIRCASTREASMNVGSFIRASACKGVFVSSRRAVHFSRSGASKMFSVAGARFVSRTCTGCGGTLPPGSLRDRSAP